MSHRYSYFSWWWVHSRPKHVEKRKNIQRKIVHQFGFIYKITQGCTVNKTQNPKYIYRFKQKGSNFQEHPTHIYGWVRPHKADSHIACSAHAVPMPFPCHVVPSIHTCHAAPLPCSDSAVFFVKVRVVAGNIRTAKIVDNFRLQLMHHNFTLLTKSLYIFRAPTCPSSGGQTIYTPQLVQCHLLWRLYGW